MRLIDLSQPIIHQGPNCPVHPPIQVETIARHDPDGWQMELLTVASHTGSHLDAPLHKRAGGKAIDGFALESFAGPAVLADLRGLAADAAIDGALLARSLPADLKDRIVLLATGWGERRACSPEWHFHSPFLSPDGADFLQRAGIRGVGIDHYSIGGSVEPGNARTHEVLLSADIWILEDLRFPTEIFAVPQPFQLFALPVNLPGFSGAFCRPVAVLP
jgi:kynurenine formamidase